MQQFAKWASIFLLSVALLPVTSMAKATTHAKTAGAFHIPTAQEMMRMDVASRAHVIKALREYFANVQKHNPEKYAEMRQALPIDAFMDLFESEALAENGKSVRKKGVRTCYYAGNSTKTNEEGWCLSNPKISCSSNPSGGENRGIICNPAFFGFKAIEKGGAEAFCVNKGPNATSDCEVEADKNGMTPEGVAKNFSKILEKMNDADRSKYNLLTKGVEHSCTTPEGQAELAETNKAKGPPPPKGSDLRKAKSEDDNADCTILISRIVREEPPPPPKVEKKGDGGDVLCSVRIGDSEKWVRAYKPSRFSPSSGPYSRVELYNSKECAQDPTAQVTEETNDGETEQTPCVKNEDYSYLRSAAGEVVFRDRTDKDNSSKELKLNLKYKGALFNNQVESCSAATPPVPEQTEKSKVKVNVCVDGDLFCKGYDPSANCTVRRHFKYGIEKLDNGKQYQLHRTDLEGNESADPIIDKTGRLLQSAQGSSFLDEQDKKAWPILVQPIDRIKVGELKKADKKGKVGHYSMGRLDEGPGNASCQRALSNYRSKLVSREPGFSIYGCRSDNYLHIPTWIKDDHNRAIFGRTDSWLSTDLGDRNPPGDLDTELFVCGDIESHKDREAHMPYCRVHKNGSGKIEYIEAGYVNVDGVPLRRQVYKPENMDTPYIEQAMSKVGDHKWRQTDHQFYNTEINFCPYAPTFAEKAYNEVRFSSKPKELTVCHADEVEAPRKPNEEVTFNNDWDVTAEKLQGFKNGVPVTITRDPATKTCKFSFAGNTAVTLQTYDKDHVPEGAEETRKGGTHDTGSQH